MSFYGTGNFIRSILSADIAKSLKYHWLPHTACVRSLMSLALLCGYGERTDVSVIDSIINEDQCVNPNLFAVCFSANIVGWCSVFRKCMPDFQRHLVTDCCDSKSKLCGPQNFPAQHPTRLVCLSEFDYQLMTAFVLQEYMSWIKPRNK